MFKKSRVKTKDLILQLQEQNKNLTEKIDQLQKNYNQNYEYILKKANQATKMAELKKSIVFKVETAKVVFDPVNGSYAVEIQFKPHNCRIYVDNGQVIKNQLFYSIASLDMMSIEDMSRIEDLIEQAKVKSFK